MQQDTLCAEKIVKFDLKLMLKNIPYPSYLVWNLTLHSVIQAKIHSFVVYDSFSSDKS